MDKNATETILERSTSLGNRIGGIAPIWVNANQEKDLLSWICNYVCRRIPRFKEAGKEAVERMKKIGLAT